MNNEKSNRSGLIATGGTLTGMFAVIGASCCILPIILVNLGVSILAGILAVGSTILPYYEGDIQRWLNL